MARSRWMFWFRLLWFSGPEDPRPSSTPSEPPNEAEPKQSLQTRATHQPADKVEHPIPLSTRVTKQPPEPSLQTRESSQAPDKAEPQILSPTRATSQPPDKVKPPPPPPPKEPSTTEEISQPRNKMMNQENPQSTKPAQEPKPLEVTTALPEKGIEPPGATFARGFLSPKEEVGPRPLEGHSWMLRGTNHDDPKGKTKANAQVSSLKERLALKSSATERNPGVHMVVTCDPEETIKPRKQREMAQTHKAEVVSDPAERL